MIIKKPIIKIRRAVADDAAAVAALILEAFVEYKPLYTKEGFEATTPSQKEIEDRIGRKAIWLVLDNDNIAGTISIFPRGEELYIRSMAVRPASRGKGIGKILMEHVQDMAFSNGCSSITLNTTPFLSQAIRLYENFGFQQEGPGDLFGTPLIKMTKHLTLVIKNKIENNDYAK